MRYRFSRSAKDLVIATVKKPRGLIGIIILTFLSVMAIFPQLFTKYSVEPIDWNYPEEYQKIVEELYEQNVTGKLVPLPPITGHPLGIDHAWRDIWARVVYGTRVSLFTGILSSLIVMFIGLFIGCIAGYKGGFMDSTLTFLSDVVMMLPGLLLLILIASLFKNVWGVWHTILLISAISWPSTARIIRAQVMQIKVQMYVEAAKCMGGSSWHILRKHVFPQVLPLALARATIQVASAIVTVSSFSFLIPEATQGADWGSVLNDAYKCWNDIVAKEMWSWFFIPGIFIALAVVGFICVGEALIEYYNPKLRGV